MLKSEVYKADTFLYFSYGSNMFTFRMHMANPTAVFVSIGRLDNYRLEFIKFSSFWEGPTPTLVHTANAHVWGVVWRVHNDDKESLNDQKGVDIKKYFIKSVQVETPYIGPLTCRAYIQKVNPLPRGDKDHIPVERWPSWSLKEIMIYGAREHRLPDCYIKYLKALKHNGSEGAIRMLCLLNRYGKNDPCDCRVPGRIKRKPLKLDLVNKLKLTDHTMKR